MNFVGGNVLNVFVRLLNGEYVAPRAGSKNDEAHPPIHPIAMPGNLDQRHGQVYEYIGNVFFFFFPNFPFSADAKRPLIKILGGVLGAEGAKRREASRFGGTFGRRRR